MRSKFGRSAVTNGHYLFDPATSDLRSRTGRRYRDLLQDIIEALGGEHAISTMDQQRARRCTSLLVVCESFEAKIASGREFDLNAYMGAVDRSNSALRKLGLVADASEGDVADVAAVRRFRPMQDERDQGWGDPLASYAAARSARGAYEPESEAQPPEQRPAKVRRERASLRAQEADPAEAEEDADA